MLRLLKYKPRNRRRDPGREERIKPLLAIALLVLILVPLSYFMERESKQGGPVAKSYRFSPPEAAALQKEPAQAPKPLKEPAQAAKRERPPLKLKEGKLKKGESIIVAMKRSGASHREAFHVSKAAASLLDLRRLRPGTLYRLYVDAEGKLRRFECLPRVYERLIVKRDEGGFYSRWEVSPLETRVYVLRGELKSSIIEDICDMGEAPSLAVRYVDALAWSVDFFRDPRKRDTFGMVYEKRFLNGKFVEYGPLLAVFYRGKTVNQEGYYYTPRKGPDGFYDLKGRSLRKAFLKAPLKFTRISSRYSRRRFHPILGVYRPHLAVDYAASRGTPVHAVGDGVVVFKGRNGGYGKMVALRHSTGYRTYYGHLSRYGRIRVGRRVAQGQVIGYVGRTGHATGPHLDYRVKLGRRFLNPLRLKIPAGPPLPAESRPGFEDAVARLRTRLLNAALGTEELDSRSVAALLNKPSGS